jgi:hypothetical protein
VNNKRKEDERQKDEREWCIAGLSLGKASGMESMGRWREAVKAGQRTIL